MKSSENCNNSLKKENGQINAEINSTNDEEIIVAISGSSGSGKSTILKRLFNEDKLKNRIRFSVSHTTRKPRPGELNGIDYHFVSKQQFLEMIKNNKFLEYASYNDNFYGTALTEIHLENTKRNHNLIVNQGLCSIREPKRFLILDLERNGILSLQRLQLKYKSIFIFCNKEEVLNRLLKRLKKSIIDLKDVVEVQNRILEYDHDFQVMKSGIYDKIVVNHILESAFEEIYQYLLTL